MLSLGLGVATPVPVLLPPPATRPVWALPKFSHPFSPSRMPLSAGRREDSPDLCSWPRALPLLSWQSQNSTWSTASSRPSAPHPASLFLLMLLRLGSWLVFSVSPRSSHAGGHPGLLLPFRCSWHSSLPSHRLGSDPCASWVSVTGFPTALSFYSLSPSQCSP